MEGETGLAESKDVDMREEDVVVLADAAAQTTSWDGTRLRFFNVTVAPSRPQHIHKHEKQNAEFLKTGCAEGEYTVRTSFCCDPHSLTVATVKSCPDAQSANATWVAACH